MGDGLEVNSAKKKKKKALKFALDWNFACRPGVLKFRGCFSMTSKGLLPKA
jgi:hypothetical protein